MTEFELITLAYEAKALSFDALEMADRAVETFVIYLFAYLLASYFVGSMLSRIQASILSLLYVFFVGVLFRPQPKRGIANPVRKPAVT